MYRSESKLTKVIFPLIAVIIAVFMAASCGGGGGAATPNPNPNPGGNPGGLQPIPGAQIVPSATVDTSKVTAIISPIGHLDIRGQAGAATPGAEIRISANSGDFTFNAFGDGSFDSGGVTPPGFTYAVGDVIRVYQTVQSFAESGPAVVTVQ